MNLDEVKQWIADGQMDAVEEAWMAAIESRRAGTPPEQLRDVLAELVAADRPSEAQTLAWILLSEATEQRSADEALDLARVILPVLPANQELRDIAAQLYRAGSRAAEHLEDFLRVSGLQTAQSLRRAVQTLDTCLAASPGAYLANRFDHNVVRVEKFDAALGEFELLSPGGRRRPLEPKLLADEFDLVQDTDFRVLQGFRPEDLGRFLEDDIAAVLIGICLSHAGQIDAPALKDLLVPRYIQKDNWSGWWNRARTAAKRCEKLTLEGRNPAFVRYHPRGRTLEEELAPAVEEARTPLAYLAVLRQYVREAAQRKLPIDPAFAGPILQTLAEQAEAFKARRPADALAASLAIDAAVALGLPRPRTAYPSGAEALGATDRPAEAVASLQEPSLWPAALDALASLPDAPTHLERLMTLAPASQLDEVAARLQAAGDADAVARVVQDALANPKENLQICLWLWQGPARGVEGAGSMLDLFSRLLSVTQEIHRDWDIDRDTRREAFHQIRAALTANDCRSFRAILKETDEGVAATIKRRIERSGGLSPTSRGDLLAILRKEFHNLFVQDRAEPWLDESVVWTTGEAYRRQEAELKELLDVRIPANSRAIGAAAAMGDLSENSEWQYAIEEQRRLQARAAQIQNDLARARVLHADDVPDDSVGIGSRVLLQRLADGQEVELTFLGPWESDVAKRVISYQAAMAQSIMGKTIGDIVMLKIEGGEGEYRIERLASAL